MTMAEKQVITKGDVGVVRVEDLVKPKIVSSVGVSANSLVPGGKGLAKIIEGAMSAAAAAAQKAGITDPIKIKALMLKAREDVKKLIREKENALNKKN